VYTPVPVVEVRIWGKAVGAVALDPKLGYYAFEYQPAFLRSGIELAPLTMPIATAREPFVFADLAELTYRRLPGMLADALPDDFGNTLIDAWMAREGVAKSQITSLDRLAYMGKRGLGALEFKPARGPKPSKSSTAIQLAALVESARRAVEGRMDNDAHAEAAPSSRGIRRPMRSGLGSSMYRRGSSTGSSSWTAWGLTKDSVSARTTAALSMRTTLWRAPRELRCLPAGYWKRMLAPIS
jgi:hypothetical protein